jgi:hypothetical protein
MKPFAKNTTPLRLLPNSMFRCKTGRACQLLLRLSPAVSIFCCTSMQVDFDHYCPYFVQLSALRVASQYR